MTTSCVNPHGGFPRGLHCHYGGQPAALPAEILAAPPGRQHCGVQKPNGLRGLPLRLPTSGVGECYALMRVFLTRDQMRSKPALRGMTRIVRSVRTNARHQPRLIITRQISIERVCAMHNVKGTFRSVRPLSRFIVIL